MQKILTLVIAAAIIYSIVQIKMQSPVVSTPPATLAPSEIENNHSSELADAPLIGNFLEKTLSKVMINTLKTEGGRLFFESLLQPMNKPNDENYTILVNRDLIRQIFNINSFGNGTVGPATCGQVVTIHYQLSDINNNLLSETTKTFTLGSKIIMQAIDNVVAGMMVGQTRQAIIPAKYAYNDQQHNNDKMDPDVAYRVNISLSAILPNNFVNMNEVKVFDSEIAYRMPLLCGDKVSFDAKITKLSDGKVIFDSVKNSNKLNMKIGDINYPMIVSYALTGKVPVGTRTVIAKGRSFKAIGSNSNRMLDQQHLPVDEYLMLELTNFRTE